MIIDEVQYAPALFRYLKVAIDADGSDRKPGRFILSGSQNFALMQGVSESLAGRCGVIQMLPLSAAELMDTTAFFDEKNFLIKGGWPELHARSNLDSQFWYAAYLSTYLERDVRNILNVGNLRDFGRFLRATAIRTGQMLSYSELARDVGIAPNTAKQWISVLQASGQIFLLEPYFRNLGKRLVKSPKVYVSDTGLAAFLMGFESWEAVARSPIAGAIWGTFVVMEVVKYFAGNGRSAPLWYWRTAHGVEVDLLIEQGGRFVAIEAKLAETPDNSDQKGLLALENFYGHGSILSGWIACRTSQAYPMSACITAVPAAHIASFIA